MKKYLILLFLMCSWGAYCENRRTVCASCMQNIKDDDDSVYRAGYGRAHTMEEADSIAKNDAYRALVQALQKSLKPLCREVKLGYEDGKYFFAIKYLDRKENPEQYFLTYDNVLVDTPLQCQNVVRGRNGVYYACCVLSASKGDFKIVNERILNEKLQRMMFYFFL